MEIELLTRQDLENFKKELINDLSKVLHTRGAEQPKEFVRSKEVKQLLGISNGTLQNLRVKGLLKPSKIEGVFYYKLSEINALLNAGTDL